LKIQTDPQYF